MATKSQKELEDRALTKRLIEDLEVQRTAAEASRAAKLAGSVEHLVKQLGNAEKRYRTINGFMQARSTIHDVLFGGETPSDADNMAKELAKGMSLLARTLADRIGTTDIEELDGDMLDEYINVEFVDSKVSVYETARQLLVVGLLQAVGPVLDETITFREASQHEIDRLNEELDKLLHPVMTATAGGLEVLEGGKN